MKEDKYNLNQTFDQEDLQGQLGDKMTAEEIEAALQKIYDYHHPLWNTPFYMLFPRFFYCCSKPKNTLNLKEPLIKQKSVIDQFFDEDAKRY